jgi:hypothetical protein
MKVLIILIGIVAVAALVMSIVCLLKKEKFDFLAISDGNIGLKQVNVPDPQVVAKNTEDIADNKARLDQLLSALPNTKLCMDTFKNIKNKNQNIEVLIPC